MPLEIALIPFPFITPALPALAYMSCRTWWKLPQASYCYEWLSGRRPVKSHLLGLHLWISYKKLFALITDTRLLTPEFFISLHNRLSRGSNKLALQEGGSARQGFSKLHFLFQCSFQDWYKLSLASDCNGQWALGNGQWAMGNGQTGSVGNMLGNNYGQPKKHIAQQATQVVK